VGLAGTDEERAVALVQRRLPAHRQAGWWKSRLPVEAEVMGLKDAWPPGYAADEQHDPRRGGHGSPRGVRARLRERLLPTGCAIDSADPLRLEEDRRAFYVAATRASDSVTFTVTAQRLGEPTARPSRFPVESAGCA
jgi:hypothetical protein